MQLFITEFIQKGENITINEERVVYQLIKVLRAKVGEQIAVQWGNKRVTCEIIAINKTVIEAKALVEEEKELGNASNYLAVALPNKFEKMELIVQKCTELGVDHIVFFVAQHSILKEISPAKIERLEKISLEASEQSWSWKKIDMTFVKNVLPICEGKKVFIAHQHGKNILGEVKNNKVDDARILLVGPEGGRHTDEEKIFDEMQVEKISFGKTILRTETAAIIGGRMLQNVL